MKTILVVDDVVAMAEQYAYDLKRIGGYETIVAVGGLEALEVLNREAVDCVILDLEMPGVDGFETLRSLTREKIVTPVIVYTGTGNYDRCIEAVRLGAYGFIDKAEPMERVVQEIENALARHRLSGEVEVLRERLDAETSIVGESPAVKALRDAIARVAPIPSPVLIVGESGSGKELVARDVHAASKMADGPFVPLNCAALPENLVESELFGHERGAFTGANKLRKGAFESADGGTLFLDEIGDLPLAAQAKLLRVLEDFRVTRLGGNREVPVTTRVLAATHRNLEAAVSATTFREDLFYRLNVHVLAVPPLRDRLSDVPLLVKHFARSTCERFGIPAKTVTPEAIARLRSYDWKRNNVRELRNIVERMIIASSDSVVDVEHVPVEIGEGGPTSDSRSRHFQELKAQAERQIVVAALERNEWHLTNTARELGLADHSSLTKIMRRHGIQRPDVSDRTR